MAVAHVAQRVSFATTSSLTAHPVSVSNPTAITVGNHLIMSLALSQSDSDISSITDPRGNTWHIDDNQRHSAGAGRRAVLASCKVASAYQSGDALTVNVTPACTIGLTVEEFSGLDGTTWFAGGNSAQGTLNAFASGVSAVAAAAGDLTFGCLASSSNTSVVVTAEANTPTAWTRPTSAGNSNQWAHSGYRIVAGSESPNFDGTIGSGNHLAIIGIYRAAGGAPPASTARAFSVIIG